METGRPDQDRDRDPPPRRVRPPDMGAQHHQPPPPQKCPRCDSNNTKFCYFNNYSLSQPRYFCKGCRRYWTHGGTLRNVPVGGGCRKSKRPKQPSAVASSSRATQPSSSVPLIPGSMNSTAGMFSGQSLIRALPPVMPSIGNSLYPGGGVLSSLGAIQTLPAGIMTQAPPLNFSGAIAGGHYGANMAILQGLNLPSLKSPTPLQFQPPNEFFPSQQSFNFPTRPPMNEWTSILSRDQASTSSNTPTTTTNFWNATASASSSSNVNPAGSSFPQTNWSTDKHLGFDPSE